MSNIKDNNNLQSTELTSDDNNFEQSDNYGQQSSSSEEENNDIIEDSIDPDANERKKRKQKLILMTIIGIVIFIILSFFMVLLFSSPETSQIDTIEETQVFDDKNQPVIPDETKTLPSSDFNEEKILTLNIEDNENEPPKPDKKENRLLKTYTESLGEYTKSFGEYTKSIGEFTLALTAFKEKVNNSEVSPNESNKKLLLLEKKNISLSKEKRWLTKVYADKKKEVILLKNKVAALKKENQRLLQSTIKNKLFPGWEIIGMGFDMLILSQKNPPTNTSPQILQLRTGDIFDGIKIESINIEKGLVKTDSGSFFYSPEKEKESE